MVNCKPIFTPLAQHEKYCKDVDSKKADMNQYRSIIGSQLYLTATRPLLFIHYNKYSDFRHFFFRHSEKCLKKHGAVIRFVLDAYNSQLNIHC